MIVCLSFINVKLENISLIWRRHRAGEGIQNVGLFTAPTAIAQGWPLSCHTYCVTESRGVFFLSPLGQITVLIFLLYVAYIIHFKHYSYNNCKLKVSSKTKQIENFHQSFPHTPSNLVVQIPVGFPRILEVWYCIYYRYQNHIDIGQPQVLPQSYISILVASQQFRCKVFI